MWFLIGYKFSFFEFDNRHLLEIIQQIETKRELCSNGSGFKCLIKWTLSFSGIKDG